MTPLLPTTPGLVRGHLNDISMVHPIFRDNRIVAFAASTAHTVDIGARATAGGEGLFLRKACAFRYAKSSSEAKRILWSSICCARTCASLMKRSATFARSLQPIATAPRNCLKSCTKKVLSNSNTSLTKSSRARNVACDRRSKNCLMASTRMALPVDGVDEPLHIQCLVRINGGELEVDFAGTSPQVRWPINSVLNYTQAYGSYAVKCLLDPGAPSNAGSVAPLTISAPPGCLLNATPAGTSVGASSVRTLRATGNFRCLGTHPAGACHCRVRFTAMECVFQRYPSITRPRRWPGRWQQRRRKLRQDVLHERWPWRASAQ